MARIAILLAAFVMGVLVPPVQAAGGTWLVMPEGERDPGLQRQIASGLESQGITVEEFISVSRLERRVVLLGVRPNVLSTACLERIEVSSWLRDARRVEMLVQTFRGRQALDLIERLEDQLVCLDGTVDRRALRDLAVHRILAMSLDGAGLLELEQAVRSLRGLGEDLVIPTGLPTEIQDLILESEARRESIRVFGGGTGFEVFVDGESLLSGAALRGQGKHLVQLVDVRKGRVTSAQWVDISRGPVLIWAGGLERNSVRESVRALADEGTPSELLRSLSTVLRNTLLVVDVGFRGHRVLHVDGRVIGDSTQGLRRVDPEESLAVAERSSPRVSTRSEVVRSQVERRFVLGAGVLSSFLKVKDVSEFETGAVLWGRFWGAGDWGGVLSVGLVQQPRLLDPQAEEFYDRRIHLPVRLGGAWSSKYNPLQPEILIQGIGKLGHDGSDRLGAGVAVGVLAPVWGLNGLRVQTYSEFGGQWWAAGITVGSEWSLGAED